MSDSCLLMWACFHVPRLEPLTSDGDGFYVEDDDQIPEVAARCQQIFGDIVTRPFWSPMVRTLPTQNKPKPNTVGRRSCREVAC